MSELKRLVNKNGDYVELRDDKFYFNGSHEVPKPQPPASEPDKECDEAIARHRERVAQDHDKHDRSQASDEAFGKFFDERKQLAGMLDMSEVCKLWFVSSACKEYGRRESAAEVERLRLAYNREGQARAEQAAEIAELEREYDELEATAMKAREMWISEIACLKAELEKK